MDLFLSVIRQLQVCRRINYYQIERRYIKYITIGWQMYYNIGTAIGVIKIDNDSKFAVIMSRTNRSNNVLKFR